MRGRGMKAGRLLLSCEEVERREGGREQKPTPNIVQLLYWEALSYLYE